MCFSFTAEAQQVNFRNYSVGDGLAQSQVFCLVEDPQGYLWMGTRGGGVSRFDGLNFRNFTSRDGLINDFVLCMMLDSKGRMVIGTNIGLSIYDGKKFTNYRTERDSITLSVSSIAEAKNGDLWLGTAKGFYVLRKNELIRAATSKWEVNNGTISCVAIDPKGKVWFGDDFGLNRLDTIGGKLEVKMFNRKDGFTNVLVRVIRILDEQTLLVGTYGGGLFRFSGERAIPVHWNTQLASKIIHDILIDGKGNWWLATYDAGVYRIHDKDSTITHFTESEGLSNNHVSALMADSWGNIWIGTSGGGVSRYSGEQFRHYTEKNGLPGNYVYSICAEGDSVLWMGTSAKGVVRMNWKNGIVKRFGAEDGFVEEKVKSIFCDTNGVYWFGTEGKGLWRLENGQFFALTTQDGLSGNWIKDLLRDASGNLWIATAGGGLTILRSDQISKLKEKDGLLRDRVNCLYRDEMKRIWYGTEGGGLGMIDAERMKNFTIAEGMSSNLIRGIREDQNGYLWVATGGGGLSRIDIYRGMKVMRFTRDNGLTSDNLYLIEIDDQNNLWVGSESGVDRLVLNENSEVKEIKHFGKQEGFQGIETCQNAVTKTTDGSIWFGTINGLTRFTPDHAEKNTIGPKLGLTGVNLFYQPLSETRFVAHVAAWGGFRDGLKLNYDENHIGFEFIGIDMKNPASVKYQWKLDGVDEDWSPWSLKRDVTYSNLAPGNYTFMVNAMNEDGVKSAKTLEFHFQIYPPFWQTWWFNVLVYGSMVLLLAGLVLFFTRRSRRRHREWRERLKLEKRMLELEQKALRLQMNPHFIFHALNSIQGMIGQKDEKTARLYLSKFSKLMRSILENSREQLIPLEKEVQTLDDYLSLEKFTRNDAFDFSIRVDEALDPEEVLIPSMLLQPFVENSIIHGFNGLNRRGKIEVEFRANGKVLECLVRDNGVGRKKAIEQKAQRDSQHKSMALIVTQERLAILNKETGSVPEDGNILIRDLTDVSGEISGTEVLIRIGME